MLLCDNNITHWSIWGRAAAKIQVVRARRKKWSNQRTMRSRTRAAVYHQIVAAGRPARDYLICVGEGQRAGLIGERARDMREPGTRLVPMSLRLLFHYDLAALCCRLTHTFLFQPKPLLARPFPTNDNEMLCMKCGVAFWESMHLEYLNHFYIALVGVWLLRLLSVQLSRDKFSLFCFFFITTWPAFSAQEVWRPF